MMLKRKILLFSLLLILCMGVTWAQEATQEPEATEEAPPPYTHVVVPAADGLPLYGEYYAYWSDAPTVLLLHQLYTDRTSWYGIIPALLQSGFNVLNVDLRGHGETGGLINWRRALNDVRVWVAWLHDETGNPQTPVAMIGSSMGSALALLGCADEPTCPTAIAISPGWSYYGLNVERAFTDGLRDKTVLLVYSERDRWPSLGVPQMLEAATGSVGTQVYEGNVHGMDLFYTEEDLLPLIIEWLTIYQTIP